MPRILAIDPGLSGGLALYEPGVEISLADLPTFWTGPSRRIHARVLLEWIEAHRPDIAFVENVWAGPDFGGPSGFRFGRAAGALEATVQCARIRMRLVAPVTWKSHHGLSPPRRARGEPKPPKVSSTEMKERSRLLAIKLFPQVAEMLALRKSHGKSEALLLAAYGAHVMANEPMESGDAATS